MLEQELPLSNTRDHKPPSRADDMRRTNEELFMAISA
jgi:hypothetical protein